MINLHFGSLSVGSSGLSDQSDVGVRSRWPHLCRWWQDVRGRARSLKYQGSYVDSQENAGMRDGHRLHVQTGDRKDYTTAEARGV